MAVLVTTLLAPGNVPALAKGREVIFEFSTKASDARLIEEAGCFKSLCDLDNVTGKVISFPDEIFSDEIPIHGFIYRIMGAMHHLAIHRARAMGGAHLVFLGSDFILSDGLLSKALSHIEEGYGLVLTAPMKVSKGAIISAILDDLNETDGNGYISIPARRLVDLGLECMHPESRQLVVSGQTRPFSKAPFPLYFPKPYGYSVRSFMFHPLVFSAELTLADVMYDYNTVDGMFLDLVLQGKAPADIIKVMDDSDDGVFFDVCADRTVKESEIVDAFSLSGVIEWLYRWRKFGVEEVYKWLLTQNVQFRSRDAKIELHEGDFDEEFTIAVLLRALDRLT
jgi:hypothetical protein